MYIYFLYVAKVRRWREAKRTVEPNESRRWMEENLGKRWGNGIQRQEDRKGQRQLLGGACGRARWPLESNCGSSRTAYTEDRRLLCFPRWAKTAEILMKSLRVAAWAVRRGSEPYPSPHKRQGREALLPPLTRPRLTGAAPCPAPGPSLGCSLSAPCPGTGRASPAPRRAAAPTPS